MADRNNTNNTDRSTEHNYSGKNFSGQGIDKAPGEETAGDTKNIIQDTQKGKNKVDGDPSLESDQPISNE